MNSTVSKKENKLFFVSSNSNSHQQQEEESGKQSITLPVEVDESPAKSIRCTKSLNETVSAMSKAGDDGVAKTVYVFVWHATGPNNYILYAVDLPSNLYADVPFKNGRFNHGEELNELSPVVVFPSKKYPPSMCCAEMDGKLYFMGGHIEDDYENITHCPEDVYIFDPLTSSKDELLKRGPKMNSGKLEPIAFVVGKSLYVLSTDGQWLGKKISSFEVLTLDNDSPGGGEWVELEDPPVDKYIQGHAVIKEKLLITFMRGLAVYDTVTRKWYKSLDFEHDCRGRSHFVGNTLYTCTLFGNISALAIPSIKKKRENKSSNSETRVAFVGNRVLSKRVPTVMSSAGLAHMGGGVFCHALVGSRRHPNPKYSGSADLGVRYFGLTIFQAFPETYPELNNRCLFFKAKLFRCLHFASKYIFSQSCTIEDCFVLQPCGFRQEGTEYEFARTQLPGKKEDDEAIEEESLVICA